MAGSRSDVVIADALIGLHPLGLRRPYGMEVLSGARAVRELNKDLRRLGDGDPIRRRKAFRESADPFRRIVEGLLSLHPEAALANRLDGTYDRSLRTEGFYDSWNQIHALELKVLLPYLPGGYLQVNVGLNGPLDELGIDYDAHPERFPDDEAGRAADQSEHDQRNRRSAKAIKQFIRDTAQSEDRKD